MNISADIYPKPEDVESWYKALFEDYKSREDFPLTTETFQELKSVLRSVYKNNKLKHDLPFWLEKMRRFTNESTHSFLKRKAIYELFYISLIGMDNVDGYEDDIRFYFSDLNDLSEESDLEDANLLLSFVHNSTIYKNRTLISLEEINKWREILLGIIDEELLTDLSPNRQCMMIGIKASQYLNGLRVNLEGKEGCFKALDNAIEEYKKLIPLIPKAPLYPLEQLSTSLNSCVETLLEFNVIRQDLEDLASEIDGLLGKRIGEGAAAERLRDRAMAYFNSGNEIMAISTLHKAKIKWMKNETLHGTILTSLMLSHCYERLKMIYAAKYYALVAAHYSVRLQDTETMQYLPRALRALVNCEYLSGGWIKYLDLLNLLIPVLLSSEKDFNLYEEDESNFSLVYHPNIIRHNAMVFSPSLVNLVNYKINKLNWVGEEINEMYEELSDKFSEWTLDSMWNSIQDTLLYKPFADVGSVCNIKFPAYGINWNISYLNDYDTNVIAEQFLSSLQILLIELAISDLHLLKADVEIKIEKTTDKEASYKKLPSNEKSKWIFYLPSCNPLSDLDAEINLMNSYTAFASAILFEISLLPKKDFFSIIENAMSEGNIVGKTIFGKVYEHFYRAFYDKASIEESMSKSV